MEDQRIPCELCRRICYPYPVEVDGKTRLLCTYCDIGVKMAGKAARIEAAIECRPHEYRTGTKDLVSINGTVYMLFPCAKCGTVQQVFVGTVDGPPQDWRVVD